MHAVSPSEDRIIGRTYIPSKAIGFLHSRHIPTWLPLSGAGQACETGNNKKEQAAKGYGLAGFDSPPFRRSSARRSLAATLKLVTMYIFS